MLVQDRWIFITRRSENSTFHVALADGIFTLEWRIERDEVKAGSEPRTFGSLYSSIELLSVASWFRYFELVHLFFLRGIPNGKERIKVALRIRATFPALYRLVSIEGRISDLKLQQQLKFNRSLATWIMINRSDSWQHSNRESMWRKNDRNPPSPLPPPPPSHRLT